MGDSRGGLLPQRMLRVPVRPSERVEPLPEPGWGEAIGAAFRTERDVMEPVQADRLSEAYRPVLEALEDMGVAAASLRSTGYDPMQGGDPLASAMMQTGGAYIDYDKVWAAIVAARARNPKAFAKLPATREQFEEQVLTRGGERGRDQAVVERGGVVANLIGSAGAAMTDPVNIATIPIGGGGRTAAMRILGSALANAGVEAIQQPGRARAMARIGEDMTLTDAAINVGVAAIGGAVLEGAGEAVAAGVRKVAPAIGRAAGEAGDAIASSWESKLAAVWDRLPEPVRKRWKAASNVTEADLPEIAELAIGRGNMSEAELAAVDLLRREAAVAKANPFVPNGAGVRAHAERLDQALAAVLADQPASRGTGNVSRGALTPGQLRSGTSLGTPTVPGIGERAALKQRIAVVESSGGTAWANPRSSARGKYQFLGRTWLAYYKRRFGETGESDAAILAKRADHRLQDALMDDLLADNAAFLRSRGEAETAGNLYLVHFAGQGGARRLLDADPDAPVASVLGADVVAANPHLQGMTASEVIAWAHRKMGQPVSPRAGARVELAGGESEARGLLQAELDRLEAERIELARQADAADAGEPSIAQMVEQGVSREADDALIARDAEPLPAPLRPFADDPPPVLATRRARTLPVRNRPSDVIEYLADRGGIRDDAGHDLRQGRGFGKVFVPRAGPLLRPRGMTIDEAGELLHEAGFFADRPTEAEVLDMLDQAVNQKRKFHAMQDSEAVAERDLALRREEDEGRLENLALEWGIDPVAERDIAEELALRVADGEFADQVLDQIFRRRAANLLDRIGEEADDYPHVEFDEDFRPIDPADAAGRSGPAPVAGAARGSGDPGAAGRATGGAEGFDPAIAEPQARVFDDPDGDGARAQVESLEHDAQMQAAEPVVRLYRAQGDLGRSRQGAATEEGKLWFTTDLDVAARYASSRSGEVYVLDLPASRVQPFLGDGYTANIPEELATGMRQFTDLEGLRREQMAQGFIPTPDEVRAHVVERSQQPDMFGGTTPADVRASLERQGEGRMKGKVAQKPPGSDGGLFDVQAQDMTFRFDEDGPEITTRQMLDELDAEQADIDALRACLPPDKPMAAD